VGVWYYTPAVRITLNLEFSCVSSYASLTIFSISQQEAFQTFPLRIFKRVLQTVLVLNHNDIGMPGTGDFLKSVPWLFLTMEGLKCLSLTDDGLIEDPALSYTP
jgi:hypothetical protein